MYKPTFLTVEPLISFQRMPIFPKILLRADSLGASCPILRVFSDVYYQSHGRAKQSWYHIPVSL